MRIVGPIPGRGTVAIEVPNDDQSRPCTCARSSSRRSSPSPRASCRWPSARTCSGQPVVADLTAMPHLLIAGATGSGKSVGLNGMICSILYKATPADVRFLMIDPKRLELSVLRGHPAPAGAGRHRRQGGGGAPALDRRQDGRALQDAAAQAGAQHRGLQPGGQPPRSGCRTGSSSSTSWPTS